MTTRGPRPDANGAGEEHVFVISVAARMSGMHAQTLRTYDRLGLVTPRRTRGGGRRYSRRDVALLREVQRLSQDEGVNLAGIKRIIALTNLVDELRGRVAALDAELALLRGTRRRELPPSRRRSTEIVVWQPRPQRGPAPDAARFGGERDGSGADGVDRG